LFINLNPRMIKNKILRTKKANDSEWNECL
jgi:hypothetical protein